MAKHFYDKQGEYLGTESKVSKTFKKHVKTIAKYCTNLGDNIYELDVESLKAADRRITAIYDEDGEYLAGSIEELAALEGVDYTTIHKKLHKIEDRPTERTYVSGKVDKITQYYKILDENGIEIAKSMEELSEKVNIDLVDLYDYIEEVSWNVFKYSGPAYLHQKRHYILRNRDHSEEEEVIVEELD